jgi:hypothetical protein
VRENKFEIDVKENTSTLVRFIFPKTWTSGVSCEHGYEISVAIRWAVFDN